MVFDFNFYCVTVKTLYSNVRWSEPMNSIETLDFIFIAIQVRDNVLLELDETGTLKTLTNEDTLLPTQMFPRLPSRATFVADTNFVSGTRNRFLILFRNILCLQQMFPSLCSPKNIMSNNVSATVSSFARALCIAWNVVPIHLGSRSLGEFDACRGTGNNWGTWIVKSNRLACNSHEIVQWQEWVSLEVKSEYYTSCTIAMPNICP